MCSIGEPGGRCKAALAILEACWAGKFKDMVPANGAGSYGDEPLMCIQVVLSLPYLDRSLA
jgi:hypothetical protein